MEFRTEPFKYKDLPEQGFVKGYYCGVPIYIRNWEGEDDGPEVCGRNWFYDVVFEIVAWLCINVRGDEGFMFKIPVDPETKEPLK